MGALIVSSLTLVFLALLPTSLPEQFKEEAFAAYVAGLALTGLCAVVMTFKNVRILVYGPKELLEQSRIEYEHNLALRNLELEFLMKKSIPDPTSGEFHDLLDKAATAQVVSVPALKGKPDSSSAPPAKKTSDA